jgi:hypothetical protein
MDFQQTAIDIITPVMEKSFILAAQYCGACGRDTITAKDFEYALKYCARYTVGEHIGSIIQDDDEDEDEDEDEDDDDIDIVEETDEDGFTRYDGDDDTFTRVNRAVDTWDEWNPESPVEQYLFNAINSNEHFMG